MTPTHVSHAATSGAVITNALPFAHDNGKPPAIGIPPHLVAFVTAPDEFVKQRDCDVVSASNSRFTVSDLRAYQCHKPAQRSGDYPLCCQPITPPNDKPPKLELVKDAPALAPMVLDLALTAQWLADFKTAHTNVKNSLPLQLLVKRGSEYPLKERHVTQQVQKVAA